MSPRLQSNIQRFVSVLIAAHVLAIVVAAFSVPPSSRLVRSTWSVFQPYLQGCNLNHGFRYFAPDPGPSHLISWAAERDDGSVTEGTFPSRETQPRLLYHRYFMLCENLGLLDEQQRNLMVKSYARCLCGREHADRVHLSLMIHRIPNPEHLQLGGTLNDPESFVEQPLGTWEWSELSSAQ